MLDRRAELGPMLAHSVAERNPSILVAGFKSVDFLFHSGDYNILSEDLHEELDVGTVIQCIIIEIL